MPRPFIRVAALLATALALGPALAHLFALPNKMALPRDAYFTAQAIYAGWNCLALLLALQLVALVALIVTAHRDRRARLAGIVALLALAGAQAVFWLFTFPANQATANWTAIPAEWEALRRQWELSHAAGAGFQLLAMAALSAGLATSPQTPDRA